MTVDVVIPSYQGWEMTRSCLTHLAVQSRAHRVIVVDDCSPDGSAERIRGAFPDVHLVALNKNVGFTRACNVGIRAGTADVVVLLNNDVDVQPEMLERLVAPFESDSRLGSVTPLLLKPDGRVDALGIVADVTVAGFLRFEGARPDAVDQGASVLLGPYGAAAAYRRTALEEVGLLDEGIYMYGEELDLALRLRAAGWHAVAEPAAVGVHIGGATVGKRSFQQRELSGYGRAYLLVVYGLFRSRYAFRAVAVELVVCALDAVRSRDFAAIRGRWRGLKAGRRAARRRPPVRGLDSSIGMWRSLAMRRDPSEL